MHSLHLLLFFIFILLFNINLLRNKVGDVIEKHFDNDDGRDKVGGKC